MEKTPIEEMFFLDIQMRLKPFTEKGEKFEGNGEYLRIIIGNIRIDLKKFIKDKNLTVNEATTLERKVDYLVLQPDTLLTYEEIK